MDKKVEGALLGLSRLLKNDGHKKKVKLSEYENIIQQANAICMSMHRGVNECLPDAPAGRVIQSTYIWCAYAGIGLAYLWQQDKDNLNKKGYITALTEERGFYEMDEYVSDLIGIKNGSDVSDILRMRLSDHAFDLMNRNIPYLDDGEYIAEQTREDYIAMLLYHGNSFTISSVNE